MRLITIVLGLVLLAGLLPAQTIRAADPEVDPKRGLAAPSLLSADANAWVSAGGLMTAAQAVTFGVAETRLNFAKAAQRELGRQHRRDRRAVMRQTTGRERECQLAELDLAYRRDRGLLQQAIGGYRRDLGYTDRRKGFTKFAAHVGRFARFVGGVVKETLREGGPELVASMVAGPASRLAATAILKRRFTRVAKDRLAREAIGRLTGARSADVLAHVVATCREEEAASAPTIEAPPGQRVNTGPFVVDGVFGYHEYLERQASAIMGWAGIAGDECADFEAYNPRPDDPRNTKLPGITVHLLLETTDASYVGVLDGLTESRDLSAGPCIGAFRSVFMGELHPLADGWGWELVPGDSALNLTYHMEAACGNIHEQWSVGPFWKSGRGTVTVEGSIVELGGYWWLELEATHDQGSRSFWVGLESVPLGEVYVDVGAGSS